ncbi:MAG: ABC transporter ATP-binding protein, partial [Terriglobales bacterium]
LDLVTQAQILNLLADVQSAHSFTCLLISHDLSLVGQIADHIAVMHQGTMVERGGRQQVFENPQHAHTRELLASVQAMELAFRAAQPGLRT